MRGADVATSVADAAPPGWTIASDARLAKAAGATVVIVNLDRSSATGR